MAAEPTSDRGRAPADVGIPELPEGLDAESRRWVRQLSSVGPAREDAVRRLHALLLRVARSELARRSAASPVGGAELDDLAFQAAADAVIAVERRLGDYRGESRFTTWVYAFAVNQVSVKLGRHFWRHPRAALDGAAWERLPARFGFDPAERSQWQALFDTLRHCIEHLTPHQHQVFTAVVLNERTLDIAAAEFSLTRGAIYKVVFDARRALRSCLARAGYTDPAVSDA